MGSVRNSVNHTEESKSKQLEPDTKITCYNMEASFFTTGDFVEWHIFNGTTNALLCIPATLMNLLVLIAIWRSRTLNSPSHVLLFCLALSDFGVGLLAQPMVVVFTIAKIRQFISVACVSRAAATLLTTYLCGISLLNITAVSIDRYLALYLHLRYKQLVTNKRVVALIACTSLFTAPVVLSWLWYPLLLKYVGATIGLGGIVVTTFCFSRIYLVLRHHHKQICPQPRRGCSPSETLDETVLISKRYKRSVLGMFMVYVLLLLCYIPYLSISYVITVKGDSPTKRLLFELTRTLLFINSALNPLVYCWRLRDIRAAVIQRLPCASGITIASAALPRLRTSTRTAENLNSVFQRLEVNHLQITNFE